MKFGILSDIHNEFDWHKNKTQWDFTPQPDVYYLNAGDTDSNMIRRSVFFQKHWDHMYSVLGNHDYYNINFPDPYYGIRDPIIINDITIAGATLWTDLSDSILWGNYIHGLIDYQFIGQLTQEKYVEAHKIQKKYLLESKADVIISHHVPTYQFLAERFKGSLYNCGFMTELSEDILNMEYPPKLWICGHTHDFFDGWIGTTRIVCNPRGYSYESNYVNYEPFIVEI